MTVSKNSCLASISTCSIAPRARERSSRAAAASRSIPPVSTQAVTTSRPWFSFSHGTQKEVSRPPEKARIIGELSLLNVFSISGPHRVVDPGHQIFLCVCRLGSDKNRVVAGDRAHDPGPVASVERQSNALRRADASANNKQVGPCRRHGAEQVGNGAKLYISLFIIGRQRISAGGLDGADFTQ